MTYNVFGGTLSLAQSVNHHHHSYCHFTKPVHKCRYSENDTAAVTV